MQHLLPKFENQALYADTSHWTSLSKRVTRLINVNWIIYLVLGCGALVLNCYRLDVPSMWFDEVLSVARARQSLPVLVKIVQATQPNMALYYILLHFWLQTVQSFGLQPTEVIVRLPSAICAMLSALVLYRLSSRFLRRTVGLCAAGLYIVNSLQLTYAQETRAYSLQLLLICLSWYALLRALTGTSRRWSWWLCYIISASLSVYVHLFSLFMLLAQFVAYACLLLIRNYWQERAQQRWIEALISILGVGGAILPMLWLMRHGGKTGWLPKPQLHDLLSLGISFAGANRVFFLFFLLLLCTVCIGIPIFVLVTRCYKQILERLTYKQQLYTELKIGSDTQEALMRQPALLLTLTIAQMRARLHQLCPLLLVFFCWGFFPLITSYAVSIFATHVFSARYLVVIVPAFLLLIVVGIETLPWQGIRHWTMALLFIIACFSIPYYYQSAQVEDWKEVTFWLQEHARSNDGIVCYDNAQGCQLSIEYYLHTYPTGFSFPTDSPGSFRWVDYDLTNQIKVDTGAALRPDVLTAYAARHTRFFFVTGRLDTNDKTVRVQATQHWLDHHYLLQDELITSSVSIRLYQTR